MKTYCKENLLNDREFCYSKILEAFKGKWKRRDYQKALCYYCNMDLKQVKQYIAENQKDNFIPGLYSIVDEFQKELKEKSFNFPKIRFKKE